MEAEARHTPTAAAASIIRYAWIYPDMPHTHPILNFDGIIEETQIEAASFVLDYAVRCDVCVCVLYVHELYMNDTCNRIGERSYNKTKNLHNLMFRSFACGETFVLYFHPKIRTNSRVFVCVILRCPEEEK